MRFFKRTQAKLPSEMSLEEHNALIDQHATSLQTMTDEHTDNQKHRFRNLSLLGLGLGVLGGIAMASTGGLIAVVAGGFAVAIAGGLEPLAEHVDRIIDGYRSGTPGYLNAARSRLDEATATRDRFFPPSPADLGAKVDARAQRANQAADPVTSSVLDVPVAYRTRPRTMG